MADNYVANAGSGGSTFAADDISSVLYARVKANLGRDGIAADVATAYKLISAASTNAQSVKASAGSVYFISAVNIDAAVVAYLKLYNKASAPTVGTDTPIAVFGIPCSTTGAGIVLPIACGLDFSTGIAIAITGGMADSDTTAIGANEVVITIGYV